MSSRLSPSATVKVWDWPSLSMNVTVRLRREDWLERGLFLALDVVGAYSSPAFGGVRWPWRAIGVLLKLLRAGTGRDCGCLCSSLFHCVYGPLLGKVWCLNLSHAKNCEAFRSDVWLVIGLRMAQDTLRNEDMGGELRIRLQNTPYIS